MAKTSWIAKHKQRLQSYCKYKQKRNQLRAILKDQNVSFKEKLQAQAKMQKLPRRSSKSAITNRCAITGRSRGVDRRYGICRHLVREYGLRGEIPGLMKASW